MQKFVALFFVCLLSFNTIAYSNQEEEISLLEGESLRLWELFLDNFCGSIVDSTESSLIKKREECFKQTIEYKVDTGTIDIKDSSLVELDESKILDSIKILHRSVIYETSQHFKSIFEESDLEDQLNESRLRYYNLLQSHNNWKAFRKSIIKLEKKIIEISKNKVSTFLLEKKLYVSQINRVKKFHIQKKGAWEVKHPLMSEKKYKNHLFIHPFSLILTLLNSIAKPDNNEILAKMIYLTFERRLTSKFSMNLNLTVENFTTYPEKPSQIRTPESSFGYGMKTGVKYYPLWKKQLYTGIDIGFFQLPDSYFYREKSNDRLYNYWSVGGNLGVKFPIAKHLSIFVEGAAYRAVYRDIIQGTPFEVRAKEKDSGGCCGIINTIFFPVSIGTDLKEINSKPYYGMDLNMGFGLSF